MYFKTKPQSYSPKVSRYPNNHFKKAGELIWFLKCLSIFQMMEKKEPSGDEEDDGMLKIAIAMSLEEQ